MSKDSTELDQFDDYTKEQMVKISDELDNIQTTYDTRLLSAMLAGRAAYLHKLLVNAGHMTVEDAHLIWAKAGEIISQEHDKEIKTMSVVDGHVFDPSKTN